MKKLLVVVLLFLATASIAHTKAPKHPVTQCRVAVLFADGTTLYRGDWEDCKKTEELSDKLFDKLTTPGTAIWTDERIQTGKDTWSDPAIHTEPQIIPHDFTEDWTKV